MKYTIIFITMILALFCRSFLVSAYKVPSNKMAPAILAGEFLLASKVSFGMKFPWSEEAFFASNPQRGDLVLYSKDSKVFIKRVIAVAQDEIEYQAGEFSINSTKCMYVLIEKTDDVNYGIFDEICGDTSQKIYQAFQPKKLTLVNKIKLEKSQFFVASDFRSLTDDSEVAELVSYDQIIGKPLFVWMSYSSTQDFISKSLGIRMNRILTKLK